MDDKRKAELAGKMGQNAQMQGSKISSDVIKNARTVTCVCGGVIFKNGLILKKVSAILSPTGQELDIPMQVLYCKDCGKVLPETDPDNVLPSSVKSEPSIKFDIKK